MRVKRGVTKRKRHKKILRLTKGYRMTYSKLYRRAKEAVLHAGHYSYNDRKSRPSQMRKEWIRVINSFLSKNNLMSYSKFINCVKKSGIILDRKVIATLVVNNEDFVKEIYRVATSSY
ncbi:50S ribosomal protein L20 [Candidatus Dojkabacteria bacterium]|uniref:Large ribosomal subunit protein bL20 n=1 Tax=Candidatus Dojkabacteria bacterium TaxID=2099670 RepID=A0A3M0Z115_9BACT|nr:MAG: 50S ribosomal protein L20 [Candidatus Dojkabacteria bacterium]